MHWLTIMAVVATVWGYAPLDPDATGTLNCNGTCAVTASGLAPGPGLAGCGMGWQLGDVLEIEGHGQVICADRFNPTAKVGPYDIDLFHWTIAEARAHGRPVLQVTLAGHKSIAEVAAERAAQAPATPQVAVVPQPLQQPQVAKPAPSAPEEEPEASREDARAEGRSGGPEGSRV